MYRIPLLLALAACDPWDLPDRGEVYLDTPTWDPAVVPAADGVYVRLPAAGQLVRVLPDGTWSQVDLDGAAPESLQLGPDGQTLLVRATWPICTDDDPKIDHVSECREEDLEYGHELDLVRDGVRLGALTDVPEEFNHVTFNADGTMGAAYLDFSDTSTVDIDLVLNLTQVTFFSMGSEVASHNVTVGFAAESVLFTPGLPRAVVLSRSQVAVVDLATWQVTVTYPLTLDADTAVVPTGVALTPDGRYAMVSVQGKSDLYVLDLEQESIDLVELDANPSALHVDEVNDRTVIVYATRAQVDVLDHADFELDSYELEEPANALLDVDGRFLLYNTAGYHDVYVFDAGEGAIDEYRAENPVMEMFLTDDHAYAVATLNRENSGAGGVSGFYDQYYGLDVFDLSGARSPMALALEGRPVGVVLAEKDGEDHALVLMDGLDSVLNIDLFDGSNDAIELTAPPTGIAVSPDGRFVIPQDDALGLLSFLDSSTNEIVDVMGFALDGLLTDDVLPRRAED